MRTEMELTWKGINTLPSRKFVCGYCGNSLISNSGFCAIEPQSGHKFMYIYTCHHCLSPTYFDRDGRQSPCVIYGNSVNNIPELIREIYDETRRCTSLSCYTAAVLCCRKLIMHIAVSKGVKEGGTFKNYVEFLSNKGYLPPDGKQWVEVIKNKGNEANHEIKIMNKEDAEDLIIFIEMLLKFIYEFPEKVKKRTSKKS